MWACAHFYAQISFINAVSLRRYLVDVFNYVEIIATVLTLGTSALAICNEEDWPFGSPVSSSDVTNISYVTLYTDPANVSLGSGPETTDSWIEHGSTPQTLLAALASLPSSRPLLLISS